MNNGAASAFLFLCQTLTRSTSVPQAHICACKRPLRSHEHLLWPLTRCRPRTQPLPHPLPLFLCVLWLQRLVPGQHDIPQEAGPEARRHCCIQPVKLCPPGSGAVAFVLQDKVLLLLPFTLAVSPAA